MERLKELGDTIKARLYKPLNQISGPGTLLTISLKKNQPINQLLLSEDNKYIKMLEKPIFANQVKLTIKTSVGKPHIAKFAVCLHI